MLLVSRRHSEVYPREKPGHEESAEIAARAGLQPHGEDGVHAEQHVDRTFPDHRNIQHESIFAGTFH